MYTKLRERVKGKGRIRVANFVYNSYCFEQSKISVLARSTERYRLSTQKFARSAPVSRLAKPSASLFYCWKC